MWTTIRVNTIGAGYDYRETVSPWLRSVFTLRPEADAPVMLSAGWPIHRTGWLSLRHRTAEMDTLITLGTTAAFGYSLVVTRLVRDAAVVEVPVGQVVPGDVVVVRPGEKVPVDG